ncbi:MAG: murein hydrolase activator EnvC family protein [Actinomycetota bacterium]
MRRATIAIIVLALVAPAAAPVAAHDPQNRLEEIQAEIEQKKKRIAAADREQAGLLEELEAADEKHDVLTVQVHSLTARLEAARARLATVQASLDAARLSLVEWTRKLDRSRRDLRDQQSTFDQRVATTYKLGPGAYLDVLLGSDDFRALVDRSAYLERVLTVDSDMVQGLETAKALVSDRQATVEELERQLSRKWDKVNAEVERISELRAREQALQRQVEQEIATREGLVDDIEQTKAEYEAAVAELQAESDRIRSVLQSGGSSGSGKAPGGQLFWPTSGSIGSGFGWRTHPIFGTQRFHAGVDIGGACGQPIWAAEKGTVVSAGYNGGYGNATVIDHGGGLATLYAHQSSFAVSSGQSVKRGQTIGSVGTTGWSTGCHLHFEVRVNGTPVDPVPYLT